MTSEFEFGPDRRGAATVVDSTASTVPLRRMARTKSRRDTLNVASRRPVGASLTVDCRADRNTAAPAIAAITATALNSRIGPDFRFKGNSPLSDDAAGQGVGGWQPSIHLGR